MLPPNAPSCMEYITDDDVEVWTVDDCRAKEMADAIGHHFQPTRRKIITADSLGVVVKWNEGKGQTFYPWTSIHMIVVPTPIL